MGNYYTKEIKTNEEIIERMMKEQMKMKIYVNNESCKIIRKKWEINYINEGI